MRAPRAGRTERIGRANYRSGDYIVVEGEPGLNFYVVERGEVEVLRERRGEPTQILAVLGPGDFFGEMALVDNSPRVASVRARTAVEVLVMGKEVFSQLSGSLAPFHNLVTQALRWRWPRSNPRLRQAWTVLEQQPLSVFLDAIPAQCLSPDDTFDDAVRMFDQQVVEFLCVLDKDARLQGIVTRNELFEAFAQGQSPPTKVGDFMRVQPIAVTADETSLTVGDLMNKHDLEWLPVVEDKESRRLIGIVRSEKMLRCLMQQT